MSRTGVDSLDRSIERTNHWLNDVAASFGTQDRRLAYRVTRSWLHTLRDRLPVTVAAHLAAQLPELLRGVFYEGWNPSKVPVKYDKDEYIAKFSRNAQIHNTEVRKASSLVTAAMRRHLSDGVVNEALGVLPADIREVLEPTPGQSRPRNRPRRRDELITKANTDELRGLRARSSAVISLYLNVPVDLAEHRGLVTKARELAKGAVPGESVTAGQPAEADLESVANLVAAGCHDWLGQTVAIFVCGELGLAEAIPMPGHRRDLAVIAPRPHLRPLLAALQRNPPYQVAVIDTKHAWVLAIADDGIDTLAERTSQSTPSPGFAGWYGLEAYRVQQRVMQLARQHYRETIGILEQAADTQRRPLVLGGQDMQISQFLSIMPQAVRQRVAGSFAVDLQTATPARLRQLAEPVIAKWTESAEAQLVNDLLSGPPGSAVTTSLDECLTAVRSRAVANLAIAGDQMIPGYACETCGKLGVGTGSCDCPDPAEACTPVPDVLEDLTSQALDGGSAVTAVRQAPFTAAAQLRFQLRT